MNVFHSTEAESEDFMQKEMRITDIGYCWVHLQNREKESDNQPNYHCNRADYHKYKTHTKIATIVIKLFFL